MPKNNADNRKDKTKKRVLIKKVFNIDFFAFVKNQKYQKWPQFWACSTHSIYEGPLSIIDKFNYLLSYLEKKALPKVAGHSLTQKNHATVKSALQSHYGNSVLLQKEAVPGATTNDPHQKCASN